ncbi:MULTISPECIES: DUF3221 domain-containing protein [unclassified Sporosarcina]|uniref:DUF3221 domain-containing protein n=1 Tax=unclassified Sporosarcina TaxID=2647733 RepID=UPI00203E322C|nr:MULTISPECIES: DUF3221 domain-containing protein [unclassified Sporosarcina]GKV67114.1 hypothetical protein NCCP2331_32670 [Sporosarcina sp. NCCP-2331]GLB57411.1 hypothetical protein NCCP2378_31990 [Sporosarcina sp. NCCP-2378]
MKKLLTLFVALSFLVACGQEQSNNIEDTNSSLEQQEGTIVDIRASENGWSQILVIPDVSEEDIFNKKEEELIKIAQEKDGAYYGFESSKYKELEVGARVIVYWKGEQLDSDPPQRGIEQVDIVSK